MESSVNWSYRAETEKFYSSIQTDSLVVGKVSVLSLVFIVTLVGNFLVCYCGIYSPRTTAMNHLIVNLALGEALIALIVIPLKIEKEILGQYLLTGDMACRLMEYMESVGLGAVTVTLAMISVDRYYSIFHPLSKINRRQARYMIVISWSFPLLSASPVMYHILGSSSQPRALLIHCHSANTKLTRLDKTFSLVQFWSIFLLPMVVVTIVYFLIINRLLGARQSKVTKVGFPKKKVPSFPLHSTVTQSSFQANLVPLSKRRSLVMNMIVMVVFLFCWSPLAALYVLNTVKNFGDGHRYRALQDFATFLALGKLCVNPAVYSFFDSILRDQLFRCTCRNRKRNNSSPVHKHVINHEKCAGGKLSEFNVSKIVSAQGGSSLPQNTILAEPLLRTASVRQATAGACLNSERLERIISNTRRYRSLGLFTAKSSTL